MFSIKGWNMFIIILLVGIICKNSYNNKKVKK